MQVLCIVMFIYSVFSYCRRLFNMSSIKMFSLLSSPAHGHFESDPLGPQLKINVTVWVLQ